MQILGDFGGGVGDRAGKRPFAHVGALLPSGEVVLVAFDLVDDGAQEPDGLDGIVAHRGLGRQHDGIRAVEHGVGHVGYLGARRPRILDHGIQHLRGGDARFRAQLDLAQNPLLDEWDFFLPGLDAQISTRHHDRVGGLEDRFEILHRLGLLDFRDDGDAPRQGLGFRDVGCVLHKR